MTFPLNPVTVVSDTSNTDVFLDEALGLATGRIPVDKFGRNADVAAATEEDIWAAGGLYNWLTSASAVRIKAGGNAADTSDGNGARKVLVFGLDENWALANEELTLAGASASSATTTTFSRVFRAYVSETGTYTGNNTGDVDIETTGGTLVARIGAGIGQSQLALYTVPAGYNAYIRQFTATVDGSKASSVSLWRRQSADTVSAPFTAKRLVHVFAELSGNAVEDFKSYRGPFPAMTDIWVSAVGATGGNAVSASFDLVLVEV